MDVPLPGLSSSRFEVKIREYRISDVDAMFALDQVCFTETFRFSKRVMRSFAGAGGAVSLVAAGEDEELAGFVIVHEEGPATERCGYVVTLDVAPVWRRQGLAARLMQEAERRLVESGVAKMALHVHTENEAAVRFYERAGYACSGTESGFYGAGLDAMVYAKRLG